GALWILQGVLTPEQFLSWGWRVSFLLSAVLVFIGLWVRLSIEESPVFAATQAQLAARKERTHQPLLEVIKHYPKEILLAMGMRLAENISYYIFTVISISYLKDYLDTDGSIGTQAVLIGSAVQVVLIPLIGLASDRCGRKPFYLAGAAGVGVWTVVFFGMLDTLSGATVALAVTIGLLFRGLMSSPQAAFFSELFGTSVSYSGASIGYQLASVLAGAPAPIIAIALLGAVNDPNQAAVGIYVAIASALTIIAVLLSRETRGQSLEHDRALQAATVSS